MDKIFESSAFWLFIGLVAGTLVQFASQWMRDTLNERRMVKDFIFELQAIQSHLADFSETNHRLRQSIDVAKLADFTEFFPLTGVRFPVGNLLYDSGALYRLLRDRQLVGHLVRIGSFYTLEMQNYVGSQITAIRQATPPNNRDALNLHHQLDSAFRNDSIHIGSVVEALRPIADKGFIRSLGSRMLQVAGELF